MVADTRIFDPAFLTSLGISTSAGAVVPADSIPNWCKFDGSTIGTVSSEVVVTSRVHFSLTTMLYTKTGCRQSNTVAVLLYNDAAASTNLMLVVANCSGSTPVLGTPFLVDTAATGGYARAEVKRISNTKLILAYVNDSGVLTVKTFTISGTTLSLDATATADTSSAVTPSRGLVAVMSTTLALIIGGDASNAFVYGVQIGSGSLSIDTTHKITIPNASSNSQSPPWGLESLGNGTHAVLVRPNGTATAGQFVADLIKITSYGATPTVEATSGSVMDGVSGFVAGVHADILVASTTRVYVGIFIAVGANMQGVLLPFNINTGTPSISCEFDSNTFDTNMMAPYGYCGGDYIADDGGKNILLIAGSKSRKASAKANITALAVDDDDALSFRTYDFAGTNTNTKRDCKLIRLTSVKVLAYYLQASTDYPAIRTFSI